MRPTRRSTPRKTRRAQPGNCNLAAANTEMKLAVPCAKRRPAQMHFGFCLVACCAPQRGLRWQPLAALPRRMHRISADPVAANRPGRPPGAASGGGRCLMHWANGPRDRLFCNCLQRKPIDGSHADLRPLKPRLTRNALLPRVPEPPALSSPRASRGAWHRDPVAERCGVSRAVLCSRRTASWCNGQHSGP